MGQQGYLMDTNAVVDFLGQKLPLSGMKWMGKIVDQGLVLSIISKIELLGFPAAPEYERLLLNFIQDSRILELTQEIADVSIQIRKKNKTKLPDAIIAATAIVYNLNLIARNRSDFQRISGLAITDAHQLNAGE